MGKFSEISWPLEYSELKRIEELLVCGICYDYMETSVMTPCSHNYCSLCIRKYLHYKNQCPACFQDTFEKDLHTNRIIDEIILYFSQIRDKLVTCISGAKQSSDVQLTILSSPPVRPARSHSLKSPEVPPKIEPPPEDPPTNFIKSVSSPSTSGTSKLAAFFSPKSRKPGTQVTLVPCPVCKVEISQLHINKHLDACLKRDSMPERPPRVENKRKPLPKLVFCLMKDTELKKKLKLVNLSIRGDRKTLENRYHRYCTLYNAECDKISPRSVQEVLKQCEEEEEMERSAQEAKVNNPRLNITRNTQQNVIDAVQRQYLESNKDKYEDLIEQIKSRRTPKPPARRSLINETSGNERERDTSPEVVWAGRPIFEDAFQDNDSEDSCHLQMYTSDHPLNFPSVAMSDDSSSPRKKIPMPALSSINNLCDTPKPSDSHDKPRSQSPSAVDQSRCGTPSYGGKSRSRTGDNLEEPRSQTLSYVDQSRSGTPSHGNKSRSRTGDHFEEPRPQTPTYVDESRFGTPSHGNKSRSRTGDHFEEPRSQTPTYGDQSRFGTPSHGNKSRSRTGDHFEEPRSQTPTYVHESRSGTPSYGGQPRSQTEDQCEEPRSQILSYVEQSRSGTPSHGNKSRSRTGDHFEEPRSQTPTYIDQSRSGTPSHGNKSRSRTGDHFEEPRSQTPTYVHESRSGTPSYGGQSRSRTEGHFQEPRSRTPTYVNQSRSGTPSHGNKSRSRTEEHFEELRSRTPTYVHESRSETPSYNGQSRSRTDDHLEQPRSQILSHVDQSRSRSPSYGSTSRSRTEDQARSGTPSYSDRSKSRTDAYSDESRPQSPSSFEESRPESPSIYDQTTDPASDSEEEAPPLKTSLKRLKLNPGPRAERQLTERERLAKSLALSIAQDFCDDEEDHEINGIDQVELKAGDKENDRTGKCVETPARRPVRKRNHPSRFNFPEKEEPKRSMATGNSGDKAKGKAASKGAESTLKRRRRRKIIPEEQTPPRRPVRKRETSVLKNGGN